MHLLLFALSATPLLASAAPANALSTPSATVPSGVAPGTPVRLRLETELKSGRNPVDTPVLFTVDQNVYGPGHVLLLERGDAATGHVTVSSGHGAFRRNGRLVFTCDYAVAQSGVRVPLLLTVNPPAREDEGNGLGEIGAEASVGKFSDGYGQSATPGGAYQQSGYSLGAAVDTARLVENGDDESAEPGQKYEAVTAGTASEIAAPFNQLFTLKNKAQIAGTLVSFNGHEYLLKTAAGNRSIKLEELASIAPLPPLNHR